MKRFIAAIAAALMLAVGVPEVAIAADYPIAYWSFDQGSTIGADQTGDFLLSPNGSGATYSGNGLGFGGSRALSLDGTSALVANANVTGTRGYDSQALHSTISGYTLMARVKLEPMAYSGSGILGYGQCDHKQMNALRFTYDAKSFWNYWYASDMGGTGNIDFSDGSWHHIAVTYDGTITKFYADFVQLEDFNYGGNDPGRDNPNFGSAFINIGDSGCDLPMTGMLDDVAIFNSALSVSAIETWANNPTYTIHTPTTDPLTTTAPTLKRNGISFTPDNFDPSCAYEISTSAGTVKQNPVTGEVNVYGVGSGTSVSVTITDCTGATTTVSGKATAATAAVQTLTKPTVATTADLITCSAGTSTVNPSSIAYTLLVDGVAVSTRFSDGAIAPSLVATTAAQNLYSGATLSKASWSIDPTWAGKSYSCTTTSYAAGAVGIANS